MVLIANLILHISIHEIVTLWIIIQLYNPTILAKTHLLSLHSGRCYDMEIDSIFFFDLLIY